MIIWPSFLIWPSVSEERVSTNTTFAMLLKPFPIFSSSTRTPMGAHSTMKSTATSSPPGKPFSAPYVLLPTQPLSAPDPNPMTSDPSAIFPITRQKGQAHNAPKRLCHLQQFQTAPSAACPSFASSTFLLSVVEATPTLSALTIPLPIIWLSTY